VLNAWETPTPQLRKLVLSHPMLQPGDFRERGVLWHQKLAAVLCQRDLGEAQVLLREHVTVSFQSVYHAFGASYTTAELA